jgi:uncharacterized protein YecT (DUF1311 family)
MDRHVAACLAMIIVAAALAPAPPALAQKNEGLGPLRPRGVGLGYRFRVEPRLDCKDRRKLGAIDRMVCASPKLLQKDSRLARELAALEDVVDEAKATELDAEQTAWLDGRKQCAGRRAVACLNGLYDTRLREVREALDAALRPGFKDQG